MICGIEHSQMRRLLQALEKVEQNCPLVEFIDDQPFLSLLRMLKKSNFHYYFYL